MMSIDVFGCLPLFWVPGIMYMSVYWLLQQVSN